MSHGCQWLLLALSLPMAASAAVVPAPGADPTGSFEWQAHRMFTSADGLPHNTVLALLQDADGYVHAGTGHGLVHYDGRDVHVYGAPNGFPAAMVHAMQSATDADGESVLHATLWPGGLARIGGDGRWQVIDSRAGLPVDATRSLLRERYRGNLWVGTVGAGIARAEHGRWTLFDERLGLPDRAVLGVGWSAPTGLLWVATARGAVHWEHGRFVPLLPATHAAQQVNDVVNAPDGLRWIAHASGLQAWRGNALEHDFTLDNAPLPAAAIQRIALRRDGAGGYELYAGSHHGLARWTPARGIEHVTDMPGLPVDVAVRDFAVLPDNKTADRLWIATDQGLVLRDAFAWTRIDGGCLRDIGPFTVEAEPRGPGVRLWLATGNGLLRIDPDGSCKPFPIADALGALTHTRLAGDSLYVFGARGVLRLPRDATPETEPDARHDSASGLVNPEITMSAIDARGRLFGATMAGLAALQPGAAPAAPEPAPLRLLVARYGERDAPLQDGMTLPPDDGSVQFRYSLFAFERQEATRYRARLVGLNDAFGEWMKADAIIYSRLPSGEYRFEVEARDADGNIAPPVSLGFRVAAHWWQQTWMLVGAGVLLLAGGLGIGRWRERVARDRALAIERQVAARTYELADANARLARAATTDPLTGLRNRRYFERIASNEEQRARRLPESHAMLVAMLDLDHFKRVNDNEGHDAGDAVLAEVARRLCALERGSDFALRWGGEEFLLLFRDVERESAAVPLRRVMQAIASEPVPFNERRISGSLAFRVERA